MEDARTTYPDMEDAGLISDELSCFSNFSNSLLSFFLEAEFRILFKLALSCGM